MSIVVNVVTLGVSLTLKEGMIKETLFGANILHYFFNFVTIYQQGVSLMI